MKKMFKASDFENCCWEDLPNDHRPESAADLRWSDTDDERLFTMPDRIAERIELLSLWAAMVETARGIPSLRVRGHNIYLKADGQIIDERIQRAAARYDEDREKFFKAVTGEKNVQFYEVSDYTDAEGIEWGGYTHPNFTSEGS